MSPTAYKSILYSSFLSPLDWNFSWVIVPKYNLDFVRLPIQERPDVWIEPSQSKIVQIKAAEIVPSDK